MLNVMTFSNDTLPALKAVTRSLYTDIGLEPVGSPNTNGLVSLGLKAFILSI